MQRQRSIRAAERAAGEEVLDLFAIQHRLRGVVALFGGCLAMGIVWLFLDSPGFVLQYSSGAAVWIAWRILCDAVAYIVITPTRTLLMAGAHLRRVPAWVVRELEPGEVRFVEDGYGQSFVIGGTTYTGPWERLRTALTPAGQATGVAAD